jgi:hypothetical protein
VSDQAQGSNVSVRVCEICERVSLCATSSGCVGGMMKRQWGINLIDQLQVKSKSVRCATSLFWYRQYIIPVVFRLLPGESITVAWGEE